MREAVISALTQRAEGEAAGWAQTHGGVGLQHHSRATGSTRAVHDVGHQVQAVLQQQAVVACKLFLADQQLHLSPRHHHLITAAHNIQKSHFTSFTLLQI